MRATLVVSLDVQIAVNTLMAETWNISNGTVVPKTEDVVLKNGGKLVEATYLYADLADSTGLAAQMKKEVTAKIIRAYINSAVRICREYGGEIRSFDGDRVMAVFMGSSRNNDAVRAALGINWAVLQVIEPAIKKTWSDVLDLWKLSHAVGIDTGEALIVRGGVRGHNDLVSIGRAPNIAAKLSDLRGAFPATYITSDVYSTLIQSNIIADDGRSNMWTPFPNEKVAGSYMTIYRSNYYWMPR